MRNVIKMFMDLGESAYQEDFEKPFLMASAEFYQVKSQVFIESCDCGEYLKKVEKHLSEEVERVAQYFDARSREKITSVVVREMITNHMQRLVHMETSGLVDMLLNDRYEDLGRRYSLFGRVTNGLVVVRGVMTLHLREMGKQLVTDPEKSKDPVEFVQRLLDERDKYDKIISTAFNNDMTFQNAMNTSFEYFINLNTRSPEFISLFVDDKLRKRLKDVREEDPELLVDKVMMLVLYLSSIVATPSFQKGQHLLFRFLQPVLGPRNQPYHVTYLQKFLFCVRSSGHITSGPIREEDYLGKAQRHELNVSTFQMCILMLFNNSNRLSYKEIEQATETPSSDLKRCLQSLACVKGKNVLRKEPMCKEIGEEDSFVVNEKFTSNFYKVKIRTVVARKETEPEKQETRHRIEEDRKPQIEAAIVRIMKSRRVLDHDNLISEVTKQLQSRFLANPTEIKKRMESLIERDFLERNNTDGKLYRYLA